MTTPHPRVLSGLDRLRAADFALLQGKRIGIVANQASVDSSLAHIVDLIISNPQCNVVRLFAPEHGLRGALQDMEAVAGATDHRTGLPIVSLYGNTESSLKPSVDMLDDLDVLVFDLQDVGARYYTFAQTLAFIMQAAAKHPLKIFVIDRPNPLGGEAIEGAPLTAGCRSFCGLYPIANRHGLTMGELALLIQRGFGEGPDRWEPVPCDLEVIPMEGWTRGMHFDDTALPWVLPSPNMPTLETAIVYPGTCFFEATNVSEGRGTTRPFEIVGAPFLDGDRWIDEMIALGVGLDGVALRFHQFVPKFGKAHDRLCSGIQIHVVDRQLFKPVRLGLALVASAFKIASEGFSWRSTAYEFVENVPAVDLLYGSSLFRKALETKKGLDGVLREMEDFENWYQGAAASFLLYA